MLPVLAAFFAAGRLVRARNATDRQRAPRAKSAELRRQREAAGPPGRAGRPRRRDRRDLERIPCTSQIGGIASAAAAGLTALDD